MDAPSADLMARWRAGDQDAAAEMFRRYAERLLALARGRLSVRLARHVDPEDVVQSAYRSFFLGAREGRFTLSRGGDLWRLLVAITLHKVRRRAEHFAAAKRSAAREAEAWGAGGAGDVSVEVPARAPTPAEAAALADTVERVLRGLEPTERRMIELRLQGYALEEIAEDARRSERTVRRLLGRVRDQLRQDCPDGLAQDR